MSNLLKNCPTYVINLTERNDKKKYIEKLFNKQKIKFEFYRPIKNESNPRKGCLESHLHLIKNAIKNNYEKILIFEDDVKFLKSIHEIKEPPNDWNMIYLGGTVHRVMDTKNKHYTRVQTWTTHAYFVNLKDKEFVNKIMDMENYNEEVDRFYLEKIHPKYKCYMTNPMMAIQKEDYSDIEKRDVNYDFMQYTLNGLRLPEHEVNENGNYVLKLDNIKLSDLPKISIITPTYKRRKLFSMALNNYENFIYPKNKIEWVIVDDSPRDGECVEDLVSHMKNVKYIRFRSDEEPMTIASKRNIGVSNASNNYIIKLYIKIKLFLINFGIANASTSNQTISSLDLINNNNDILNYLFENNNNYNEILNQTQINSNIPTNIYDRMVS